MKQTPITRRRLPLASLAAVAAISDEAQAVGGTWEQDVVNYLNAFRQEANEHELFWHGYYRSGPRLPLILVAKMNQASALWVRGMWELGYIAHEGKTDRQGHLIDASGKPLSNRIYPWEELPQGPYTTVRSQLTSFGLRWQGCSNNCAKFHRTWADVVAYGFYYSGYNDDPWLASGHYANLTHPFWTHTGLAVGSVASEHGVVNDFARLLGV